MYPPYLRGLAPFRAPGAGRSPGRVHEDHRPARLIKNFVLHPGAARLACSERFRVMWATSDPDLKLG
jgi:hypothetical protein